MQDNHKPNHRCLACGIEYYACDSCDKKISKTWRSACCTEGHYNAYYAMWQYGQGQIDKDEARRVLEEQDALSWSKAPGRALIEEIMGYAEDVPGKEGEPEPAAAKDAEDQTGDQPSKKEDGVQYVRKKKRR